MAHPYLGGNFGGGWGTYHRRFGVEGKRSTFHEVFKVLQFSQVSALQLLQPNALLSLQAKALQAKQAPCKPMCQSTIAIR